tara:strand:+ start:3019 stop:3702 length:684 start_codon:yes stop_codon:yes gene_type:complete
MSGGAEKAFKEAEELSRQIMVREKLSDETMAINEALGILMYSRIAEITDDRSFSEQYDELINEIHPRDVRDLLKLRLSHPRAYYAKPGARRIASDRDLLFQMRELLPDDLTERPHDEQDELLRDANMQLRRPPSSGRPMTRPERVIWKRCVRLARHFDPRDPETEVLGTMAVLSFEHELDGRTGEIPMREVLRALKQRLKNPERFQERIERTRPLADLHFAETLPQA